MMRGRDEKTCRDSGIMNSDHNSLCDGEPGYHHVSYDPRDTLIDKEFV